MNRQEAIEVLTGRYLVPMEGGADEHAERVNKALDIAIDALNHSEKPTGLDLISRPRGECASCKRSSDHCCKTDEDKTRCPIEEHYALPRNGYCHLYEQI